jgi:hypothetical protein
MIKKYPGGIIYVIIPATSRGVFNLTTQMFYKKLGIWA